MRTLRNLFVMAMAFVCGTSSTDSGRYVMFTILGALVFLLYVEYQHEKLEYEERNDE